MRARVPARKMVAIYDYNPHELSPNVDVEVFHTELALRLGHVALTSCKYEVKLNSNFKQFLKLTVLTCEFAVTYTTHIWGKKNVNCSDYRSRGSGFMTD